jgi:hypothetical protein
MSPDERTNFDRTLELGEALAKDLDDQDLLGRWMAHHISDLITRARTTSGPDSDTLKQEATDTILKLWEHRAAAPLRSRPTHSIDVVIKALARLENPQDWGFYQTFRPDDAPDQNTIASIPALKLALDLEVNTRDVVIQVLKLAADEADKKDAPWIQVTEHLAGDTQRSIWRLMRQVNRRRHWQHLSATSDLDDLAATENNDSTAEEDDTGQDSEAAHVLASLRDTQARLAQICAAIEHAIGTRNAP